MRSRPHTALFRWLLRHWLLAYLLMATSFVAFGVMSFNLVQYMLANVEFLTTYGLQAIEDGGLWQLGGLLLSAFLAVAFWLFFKLCEQVLVERLASKESKD